MTQETISKRLKDMGMFFVVFVGRWDDLTKSQQENRKTTSQTMLPVQKKLFKISYDPIITKWFDVWFANRNGQFFCLKMKKRVARDDHYSED